MFDQASRMFLHNFFWSYFALSTWVSRVGENNPVVKLLARHPHFFSVDNYHMVAHVGIGGVSSFVFAAKYTGYLAGQTAQHLVFCIHQYPVFFSCGLVGVNGSITVLIHFLAFWLYEN